MPSTPSNTKSRRASKPPAARPRVIANFALTADARISTRNKTPADFSSRADKRRLLEIRASGDAVLIGKGTLEAEDIAMSLPADLRAARADAGKAPVPLRVIVSNSGRIDPGLKIFRNTVSPVVIYSTKNMPPRVQAALAGVAALHLSNSDSVDLRAMLQHLRLFYKCKTLVCEGGAALFRSLLARGLVDELRVTLCPRIFGGAAAPALTGAPGDFLPRGIRCKLLKMEVVDDECFLRYRVRNG